MITFHFAIMRSYAKNWAFKKTTTFKQRQTRLATEWDVRLDVGDVLTIDTILQNIRTNLHGFLYVAVSGIERPDTDEWKGTRFDPSTNPTINQHASNGEHVHLCIVLLEPKTRNDVLQMLRGRRKLLDEYCAPRNPKFSYAGWLIHHAKPEWKIPGEPPLRFEHGMLPMDPLTIEWALKVDRILKKWGFDLMHRRFKMYTDLIIREKTLEKVEGLLMSLEDRDVTESTQGPDVQKLDTAIP